MTGAEALLIGAALTAAGAGVSYGTAVQANKARSRAQNQWMQWQKEKSRNQAAMDEANRKKADAARGEGLNKLADAQGTVDTETQRLTEDLGADNPTPATGPQAAADALLSGGNEANPDYKKYLAGEIAKGAQKSRAKTAALAAMQAYTGGQFGLQNTNARTLQDTQDWLDLYNNNRRGDLTTYGNARQITPKQVNPNPLGLAVGGALGSVGGSIAGGF